MVEPLKVLAIMVCKKGLQKICKLLTFDLGSKLGVMRDFQKGIALGGRTSESFCNNGLQKRVAKKFANYWHLTLDLSWGS